jgi:ABC-type transport system substrate-binding protein
MRCHGKIRERKVPRVPWPHVSKNPKSRLFVQLAAALFSAACVVACSEGTPLDDPRVFRYNESAAITSLDPAAARSLEHMWVVDQLYDGLVELTPSLEVAPCLATSWTFNDSLLTYRFVLREGAQFTTGRPVTAHDVVASLERLRDPEVLSSGGWILEAVAEGGIVAVDSGTVDIQLTRPYPPFLGLLTTAYGSILDAQEARVLGPSLRDTPAGSGPFKLAWWVPDAGLVLHRNELYWERDSEGQTLPYLEAVHVDVVQDMGAEFLGLTQGRYDFISGLHPAYMETLLDEQGELRETYTAFLRHEYVPFLKTDYLGVVLDGTATPEALRDGRVRRAMSLALDRHGLAKHLRRNSVAPTDHFVPPSMLGMSEPHHVEQDLAAARELLAQAGYPEGRGVGEVVLSTTSDYVDMCAAFQHDWAALGLDVKIDVVPASVHRERVAQGETSMFYKSWLADHADAENFLGLFVETNFSPNGPNYTHYRNPAYERGFSQALGEAQNASQRLRNYVVLDSLIHRDMPVIPLFHDRVTHILSGRVTGWEIHPVNRLDLRRVRKVPRD